MSAFASASASEDCIVLTSNDGADFPVARDLIKNLSGFVGGAFLQDLSDNQITVPLVDGANLQRVVEFCAHYAEERMKEFAKPLANPDLTQLVQAWYVDFISKLDQKQLFELTLAANFMDIRPLLDLCCARIASFIKGQTPEKIRANLSIPTDFTPEEEAAVKAENKWAEDI